MVNFKNIKRNYIYDNNVMLKESIQYPYIMLNNTFNNYYVEMVNNRLNKDFRYYGDAIDNYKKDKQEGYTFSPYEIDMTTTVTLDTKNLISLYIDNYEYLGGAHGNTDRVGNSWNLITNGLLTLSDLFDSDYQTVILNTIKKEAARRMDSGNVSYFEDLDSNIEKYFNPNNFYLDKIGVNIFYPLYTIGPYYIGIQVFNIPYILLKK